MINDELLDFIGRILVGIASVLGMVMAGLWIALIIWAFRDMRRRSRDPFAQILAALLVAAIPFVGIVLYLIVRPPETLAERYERALEEEALLQEIEERPRCYKCKRIVEDKWAMCPSCHAQLKKQCARCYVLLEMKWRRCPQCTEIQPNVPQELTPEMLLKTIFPPAPIVTVTSSQTQLPGPPQQLPPPDQTRPIFRRHPVAVSRPLAKSDDNPTVSTEPIGIDEDENPTIVTGMIDVDAVSSALNGNAPTKINELDIDENPTLVQQPPSDPDKNEDQNSIKEKGSAVVKKVRSKNKRGG